MAEPGLTEIVTTTLRLRQKKLRDNITNNNAVIWSMNENGAVEEEGGGRTIIEEMWYAENGTFQRYDGGTVLNTSYNTTMTSAEFNWKQFACAVVLTGREMRMNAGAEAAIKLLKGRIDAAEYTLENNYNSDVLSDGTTANQIGGLKLLIAKTPTTGTVGGIDRATSGGTFYRNTTFDCVGTGGATTSAANIKDYYTTNIINTTRSNDTVDMILAGKSHYRFLMSALQAIQRLTDPKMAQAGFKNIEYEGVPVILGGGVSFGGEALVQDDLSYGLNTKFIKLRVHKDANMEPLPEVQSINQDAKVQLIVWMGNMTTSAPKLQFVMWDS